jgi:hypothetical protein
MHKLQNYVATATFCSSVGWAQEGGSANMLKNKGDKEDAVVIIVGKVLRDRVMC